MDYNCVSAYQELVEIQKGIDLFVRIGKQVPDWVWHNRQGIIDRCPSVRIPVPYRQEGLVAPLEKPQIEVHALLCTPPLDHKDQNPVTRISVAFQYDWTHHRMVSMDVTHSFYYGGFVNRFQQYGNVKLGFDGSIFGWTGTLMRNPAENMAGGVFTDEGDHWYYREKHWKNGVSDFDITAPCVPMPEDE